MTPGNGIEIIDSLRGCLAGSLGTLRGPEPYVLGLILRWLLCFICFVPSWFLWSVSVEGLARISPGSISACSTLLQKDHEADEDDEPSGTDDDAQGRKRLKDVWVEWCV
jgi:hypothetical protein